MGTSQESFDQVKDILRKLDRSIDQARSRRLATRTPVRPSTPAPLPLTDDRDSVTIGQAEHPVSGGTQGSDARPTNRARPLQRRDNDLGPSIG